MPLEKTLAELRDKFAKMIPAEPAAVMEHHVEFLRASGAVDQILKRGATSPMQTALRKPQLMCRIGKIISMFSSTTREPITTLGKLLRTPTLTVQFRRRSGQICSGPGGCVRRSCRCCERAERHGSSMCRQSPDRWSTWALDHLHIKSRRLP